MSKGCNFQGRSFLNTNPHPNIYKGVVIKQLQHTMAQKKILSVMGITFFLFLSLSLVSAAVNFSPETLEATANPHSEANIQFNIYNDQPCPLTEITGALSDLIYGSETISADNIKLINLQTSINNESTSSLITLNIRIPEYQKSGVYTGELSISGKYQNNVGPYTLPITLTINQTPSISITPTKALTLDKNGTIEVKNIGNTDLTDIQLSSSGDFNIIFSQETILFLSPGDSSSVEISSDELEDLNLDTNQATILASASDGTNASTQISFTGSFCRYGEVGSRDLEIIKIRDRSGLNDDWEWEPLDDIEVDVKIENGIDDEDLDLMVELILVDEDGDKMTDFVDDEDDLEQDVSINENEVETITFNFQISLDAEEGDYYLHAKVYEEGKEDELCTSLVAEESDDKKIVTINKENHKVIVKGTDLPSTLNCDDTVEVTLKTYNIGEKDEEKVLIKLFSPELGIEFEKEITNLDEGDNQLVSFIFDMPKDTLEGAYRLRVLTKYDYDEDDETYDEISDTEDFYEFDVNVIGDCIVKPEPSINAKLISEKANLNEELVIEVTITNNGDESTSFVITPTGYEDWAEFIETNPSTLDIDAGKSGKTTIKLKPTKSGEQKFDIKAVYSGTTKTQPVQVNIEGPKSGFLTGFVTSVGNTGLYIISGIVILLIFIIILLIIKMARTPKHPVEF